MSPGNRLQRGKKCSSSMNVPVGLKPILPKFHVCTASFPVLNLLWFAVFSQQLVTRAPCSLVQSCLLIGSYTLCCANWMQSRIHYVTCNANYHNHDTASTNGEPGMRPMSMYHVSPFHTTCLMYLLYTVSQFHTTCLSSIPANLPSPPFPSPASSSIS